MTTLSSPAKEAAMARTQRSTADLGPTIRVGHGPKARDVPMRVIRGDVVEEFRPDPDKPQGVLVKGARAAQGGHDYLRRRGSLDEVQHAAASRFCDAWHGMARSACTLAGLASAGARLPPHQQGHPAPAMVECATYARMAQRTLGPSAHALVVQVVINGVTLGNVGGAAGEGDQVTLGRLRAALDRLAEMWGLE